MPLYHLKINTQENILLLWRHTLLISTQISIFWKKLAFHLPYVLILGTDHCSTSPSEAFKRRRSFQNVLCHHEYAERVVARFTHQIQSA